MKTLLQRYGWWPALTLPAFVPLQGAAQTVPPEAIAQFEDVIGNRVEAVTILGGDYGAAGGIYTFRGGTLADLSVSKIGGGGDVAEPRALGACGIKWAPMLVGNVGYISAQNTFANGFLVGNRMWYGVLAVQGGAGARFYFTDHLSLGPTLSGIYSHTENEFQPRNAVGDSVKAAASGTFVDWQIDTWSIVPALEAKYDWRWGRVAFEFASRYTFFHTESFHSTSPFVNVNGDSHLWENKIDADVPLGWHVFGRELHVGGFFARTELFGGAAQGLNENHVFTANGRIVLDFLGAIWALRWAGVGVSYFWSDHFGGWSAGLDLSFQF